MAITWVKQLYIIQVLSCIDLIETLRGFPEIPLGSAWSLLQRQLPKHQQPRTNQKLQLLPKIKLLFPLPLLQMATRPGRRLCKARPNILPKRAKVLRLSNLMVLGWLLEVWSWDVSASNDSSFTAFTSLISKVKETNCGWGASSMDDFGFPLGWKPFRWYEWEKKTDTWIMLEWFFMFLSCNLAWQHWLQKNMENSEQKSASQLINAGYLASRFPDSKKNAWGTMGYRPVFTCTNPSIYLQGTLNVKILRRSKRFGLNLFSPFLVMQALHVNLTTLNSYTGPNL